MGLLALAATTQHRARRSDPRLDLRAVVDDDEFLAGHRRASDYDVIGLTSMTWQIHRERTSCSAKIKTVRQGRRHDHPRRHPSVLHAARSVRHRRCRLHLPLGEGEDHLPRVSCVCTSPAATCPEVKGMMAPRTRTGQGVSTRRSGELVDLKTAARAPARDLDADRASSLPRRLASIPMFVGHGRRDVLPRLLGQLRLLRVTEHSGAATFGSGPSDQMVERGLSRSSDEVRRRRRSGSTTTSSRSNQARSSTSSASASSRCRITWTRVSRAWTRWTRRSSSR